MSCTALPNLPRRRNGSAAVSTARRYLFVIHYPVFGGPHNQALRLAAPLAAAGWETVVLLPDEPGNSADRLREAGLEVVTAPLSRIRATRDVRRHAREPEPDERAPNVSSGRRTASRGATGSPVPHPRRRLQLPDRILAIPLGRGQAARASPRREHACSRSRRSAPRACAGTRRVS